MPKIRKVWDKIKGAIKLNQLELPLEHTLLSHSVHRFDNLLSILKPLLSKRTKRNNIQYNIGHNPT